MLSPVNSIIKNAIGDIIYRGNVVTGIVATDNGNGSYDCYISESDVAYPKIFTLSRNPNLEVGDKVRILYKGGNKELPIILPPIAPSVLTLFENQPIKSFSYPSINLSTYYLGQHFTVESNHSVSRIDISLEKGGETQTGTAILDLYIADENGYPTGGILATADIDTSLLNWWSGEGDSTWIELTLDTSVDLVSGNEMVIVLRFPTASTTKEVIWAQSVSFSNLILSGRGIYSEDSGSTWAKRRIIITGGVTYWADFTFKIYGR